MNTLKFTTSKEELETLISEGLSVSQIAKKLNHPYTTIPHWIKKWNLSPSKFGYTFRDGKEFKKCPRCKEIKEVNNKNFPIRKRYAKLRKRCGFERRSISECRECNRKRTFERNNQFKQKCVEYKGGKCTVCGYEKCLSALDFHHRNPNEKDFEIGDMRHKPWELIKTELDKCNCVCRNCHAEIHFNYRVNSF
jgi:phage FluMu protein Com